MTTVNVVDTPGSDYTWNSGLAWTSIEAAKPWYSLNQSATDVSVGEPIHIGDAATRSISKTFVDAFNLADQKALGTGKNFTDAFHLADTIGRTVAYVRAISEGLNVADALGKAVTMQRADAFAFADLFQRAAAATISDMIIGTGDIDMATFSQIVEAGHAPGYTDFKEFVPGDYEYRYAIFRTVMESINSDRARLLALKVDVDVPDVSERGSATVFNPFSGASVTFTRTFHAIPEVTVTLKGGSSPFAVPYLTGQSTTGFSVVLKNASGSFVTGSFTWVAQGY